MIRSDNLSISQVAECLAHNGYEVAESEAGVLRVRDVESKVAFRAALEGNVLFMSVNLMTVPAGDVTPELMRKMLSAHNGISTSSFQLYDTADGKAAVTLN